MKTTNGDPYNAVLHVAQRLQVLEDKRSEFSRLIDDMLTVARQLMRSSDLTADDKVVLATIMQDARGDRNLMRQMAMFDRMRDWGDVLASFRADPFDEQEA